MVKYCLNCKQNVEPKSNFENWIIIGILSTIGLTAVLSFIGFFIGLLITVISAVVSHSEIRCPICHAKNFKK
jgi:ABC-type amino acid transport system permease subunit